MFEAMKRFVFEPDALEVFADWGFYDRQKFIILRKAAQGVNSMVSPFSWAGTMQDDSCLLPEALFLTTRSIGSPKARPGEAAIVPLSRGIKGGC
jgi:hypothetical protein